MMFYLDIARYAGLIAIGILLTKSGGEIIGTTLFFSLLFACEEWFLNNTINKN